MICDYEGTFSIRSRVVMEDGVHDRATVVVEDGRIASIIPHSGIASASSDLGDNLACIEAEDHLLLPGFIDVHVHGGVGYEFMDATKQAFDAITHFHSQHGTTTMLATTVTAAKESLDRVLTAVENYRHDEMPYAKLHGVHLEGPFIHPQWVGAQNPAFVVEPNPEWVEAWLQQYPDLIRMLTLAPELKGAHELISLLHQHNIVCACGHTSASYEQVMDAVELGLRHAVHVFNAMKGLHHREPGALGAVLSDQRISTEIIADGQHVHAACIRMLTQLKKNDNLMLITDATPAAGLPDGAYSLGGLDIVVTDGVVRLKEGGNLAGSALTMMQAFRYMVETIGLSIEETSRLASVNPAKLLGLDQETGSIFPGKRADLVLVSANLDIEQVWVDGKPMIR